jgi:flavin reductase (DIM6/NTAB) family NADH-FMN oxidoreductase RutF
MSQPRHAAPALAKAGDSCDQWRMNGSDPPGPRRYRPLATMRDDGCETPLGFTPGPETVHDFRHALGRFVTGVTVVTCAGPRGPVGITANSFASVSLDPPLVLWSPSRRSGRFPVFVAAPRYAIHILDREQEALARHFTRHGHLPQGMAWAEGDAGLPVLPDCLARFDCQAEAAHDGGDHVILVGRVRHARVRPGAPLAFLGGIYGGFAGD